MVISIQIQAVMILFLVEQNSTSSSPTPLFSCGSVLGGFAEIAFYPDGTQLFRIGIDLISSKFSDGELSCGNSARRLQIYTAAFAVVVS